MQLVGARDAFIHRPFLLEGGITGALGGVLAVAARVYHVLVGRLLPVHNFMDSVGMGRDRGLDRHHVRSARERIRGP